MRITRMKIVILPLFVLFFCSLAYCTANLTFHNVGTLATPTLPLITQTLQYQDGIATVTYSITYVEGLVAWQIDVYSPDNPAFINMTIPNDNIFAGQQTFQLTQFNSTDTILISSILSDVNVTGQGTMVTANYNATESTQFLIRAANTMLDGPIINGTLNVTKIPFQTLPEQTYP